ncbi:MAG: phospholipid carrier-dependent glycosyltransferase [Dehalococcoidia bacterium]|nr:phospholipid carrier-dependent glycosyltransferase [Dehalococcoidia bacterium]
MIAGSALFLVTLVQGLTPPWDYDGVMYHLQGPRKFLEARRVVLLPDIWQANGPFTVEMLYAVGLSFDSAAFAKLVHLSYAVMLVLGTFILARDYLGGDAGWTAAAILVGIPIFPLWASFAYADMAWAMYELLALCALLRWSEQEDPTWLYIAGIGAGFAVGSKYLALGGAGVLGLWVLWRSRTAGWRRLVRNVVCFGGIALLVGAPWYAKNWILGGNPVYPAFFGGQGWSGERLRLYNDYHHSFGTVRTWTDYLLLPWSLYSRHSSFGTFQGSVEIPSFLFPLAVFWPIARPRREPRGLGWIVVLRFVAWAVGSLQTRFLLPVFPICSVLVAGVLARLSTVRFRQLRVGRIVFAGLVGGVTAATVLYSILFFCQVAPLPTVVGLETPDGFLRRRIAVYPAIRFIVDELPADARVLMMWDGQGYYCDDRCLVDAENSRWTQIALRAEDTAGALELLQSQRVTHLLFGRGDADFILLHDATGEHKRAALMYLQGILPDHCSIVYADEWVHVCQLKSTTDAPP